MHIIKQHVVNGMLILKLVLGYSIETILCLREKLITIFDVVLKVQLVIFWSFYYSDYRFCQCSCHYKSFDWAKLFSNYQYCYFIRVSKRGHKARYVLCISHYKHIKMMRRRVKITMYFLGFANISIILLFWPKNSNIPHIIWWIYLLISIEYKDVWIQFEFLSY